jgi:hypothetical protein
LTEKAVEERVKKVRVEYEERVEELEGRLAEAERAMKEAQGNAEKRVEENFTLKQRLDGQRGEMEKMRKRIGTLED